MNRLKIILIILIPFCLLDCSSQKSTSDNNIDQNNRQKLVNDLYDNYDKRFLELLAEANQITGSETITVEQLSDKYTTPKKLIIKGTPYDIGFTIGYIAKRNGTNLRICSEKNLDLNRKIFEMYDRIYPQYLEITGGIADAYEIDPLKLDMAWMEYNFYEFWGNFLQYDRFNKLTDFGEYGDTGPTTNCSIASYKIEGKQIIGRNFDNPSDRPHYFVKTEMEGVYKMMGHTIYFMYHWSVDGINEKGLSINCASNLEEYAWREGYPKEPAVFSGHMARIVMDTCATVEEAIDLIGSVRIWFPNEGLHWIIVDRSGRSIVVEFDLDRNMVVIDRNGPYELITNTALQKGEEYVSEHCWRYRTARSKLEEGIENTGDMFDIMKTIGLFSSGGGTRTLWTSIMENQKNTFEVHYRKEYEKVYKFEFDN